MRFFLNLPGPNAAECRAFVEQGLRVLDRLENLPFPTCAAIDGAALGGGLEVALACDWAVRMPNAVVRAAMPETQLGLIPGWGGTQRLARRMGVAAACEAVATGTDIVARLGRVVQQDKIEVSLLDAAMAIITIGWMGSSEHVFRRTRVRRAKTADYANSIYRKDPPFTLAPNAPRAAIESVRVIVQGARLPLADAIKLETEAFLRLAGSDESKRLIRAFFDARKR